MAIMTTGNNPLLLWPGLNTVFGLGYKEHDPIFDKIADVTTSSRNFERDVLMTPLGLPVVKGQGLGVTYDSMRQNWSYDYNHVVYGLGIIITREELDDELYGVVGPGRAKALGRVFRANKDIITTNILNNAFASGVTYGDGVSLLNTAHPLGTGGTFANKPTVDANLSESALENAFIDINTNFVDDRGIKMETRVKRLIIHPNDQFNAARILDSALQNSTSNNAINALKQYGTIPEVCIDVYLTSSVAWFLKTDVPNGIRLLQRDPLQFTADNDFDTENMKFKARERFSVGVTDPRGAYGSSGS